MNKINISILNHSLNHSHRSSILVAHITVEGDFVAQNIIVIRKNYIDSSKRLRFLANATTTLNVQWSSECERLEGDGCCARKGWANNRRSTNSSPSILSSFHESEFINGRPSSMRTDSVSWRKSGIFEIKDQHTVDISRFIFIAIKNNLHSAHVSRFLTVLNYIYQWYFKIILIWTRTLKNEIVPFTDLPRLLPSFVFPYWTVASRTSSKVIHVTQYAFRPEIKDHDEKIKDQLTSPTEMDLFRLNMDWSPIGIVTNGPMGSSEGVEIIRQNVWDWTFLRVEIFWFHPSPLLRLWWRREEREEDSSLINSSSYWVKEREEKGCYRWVRLIRVVTLSIERERDGQCQDISWYSFFIGHLLLSISFSYQYSVFVTIYFRYV